MKCVIVAGGFGTRISEESGLRPKPMVEIGGRPILWHIMKIYSHYGINEFVICLGYKGYAIKEYFANYFLHQADVTFDLGSNEIEIHQSAAENWKVTLVDTGISTMTGGRLKRIRPYLGDDPFCFTYGDGVGNIDIAASIAFHKAHGKLATVTGVRPPGRFGQLKVENKSVVGFSEKTEGSTSLINGGFFVLHPDALNGIEGDQTSWEKEPLEQLSADGNLECYVHDGFWMPMDTLRDRTELERLWASGDALWKVWNEQ